MFIKTLVRWVGINGGGGVEHEQLSGSNKSGFEKKMHLKGRGIKLLRTFVSLEGKFLNFHMLARFFI